MEKSELRDDDDSERTWLQSADSPQAHHVEEWEEGMNGQELHHMDFLY